jgi:hypothetical protein
MNQNGKVVAFDDNGKAVAEQEVRTATKPYQIVLDRPKNNHCQW